MSTSTLRKTNRSATRKRVAAPQEKKHSLPFGAMSSADLEAKNWSMNWLVRDILVDKQPGVIGGPLKSLKTSLAVDLAISLGSQRPFLGQFDVPRKRRVAMFSGETVRGSFRRTFKGFVSRSGPNLQSATCYGVFNCPA